VSEVDIQMKRDGTIEWAEQIFVTLHPLVLETHFPLLRLNKTFLRVFTGFICPLKTSYFLCFHVQDLKKMTGLSFQWVAGWHSRRSGVTSSSNSYLLPSDWGSMSDDPGEGHTPDPAYSLI